MDIEYGIDSHIDQIMSARNVVEKENHIGSRKLTAGYLFQPKRFQLLKYLGVPEKDITTFSLRKMYRGRQVEDWFTGCLKEVPGLLEDTQVSVDYRGVIGVADAVLNHDLLGIRCGTIPHEVKSVTNKNFKYIQKGDVSEHYKLQAGFYAMAMGIDKFGLDFIASDDLRTRCYVFNTKDVAHTIDSIITGFDEMVENHIIPEWEYRQAWQNNPEYMKYDVGWTTCTEQEFRNGLEELNIIY